MEKEQLIPASDCCTYYHIDVSFIHSLKDAGLLQIAQIREEEYLEDDQLQQLEKYIRLHYDLEINVEGIEAISHLLAKTRLLEQEIHHLKNKLRFYEPFQKD